MNGEGYPDSLSPALIDWDGPVPRSRRFGDIYYGRTRADDECRYVYLDGNRLAERFRGARQLVVAETGFGAGLNFLLCRELWRRVAPADAQLDYASAEQYPLTHRDLRRALSAFPALRASSAELCSVWPPAEPGFRRLSFDDGRCRLTLLLGEAGEMLDELDGRVDAWFLDGFAPARNPDMWRDSLIERVAALSAEEATFSTFTASGFVRRSLQRVGFRVERCPGFGAKREMLRGSLSRPEHMSPRQPWFALARPTCRGPIAVIGAGLAGCATANALARRGREVLVFERHENAAAEASGNPAGVVMPLISSIRGLPQRWYSAAFRYALKRYESLGPSVGWHPTGVLHCALEPDAVKRLEKTELRGIWPTGVAYRLDSAEASAIAGVPVPWPALHFPEAGWIEPRAVCNAHLSDGAVDPCYGRAVAGLEWGGDEWCLLDPRGRELVRVAAVVLSTGIALEQFPHVVRLPAQLARGQITLAQACDGRPELRAVLGGMGYTIPGVQGGYLIGATYHAGDSTPGVRAADDRRNLDDLGRLCPAVRRAIDEGTLEARVGFRSTTPDTLPLVGPVPDDDAYRVTYARLDLGRRPGSYPLAPYRPGIYISGGHGSRALVSSPLAAEVLASEICGTPMPIERGLMHATHPARFIIRELSRS